MPANVKGTSWARDANVVMKIQAKGVEDCVTGISEPYQRSVRYHLTLGCGKNRYRTARNKSGYTQRILRFNASSISK